METQETIKIELNSQILFDRPNCLFVGRVVEIREKALKVDYCLEPIFAGGSCMVPVFNWSVWVPKSVMIEDKDRGFTVKKWFAKHFKGGHHIKKYMLGTDNKPQFI